MRSLRAGEQRMTPKGALLKGLWKESYWYTHLGEVKTDPKGLCEAIAYQLQNLAGHRDFFHKIRAEGGRTEFFVGWFFIRNGGDVFDCDLLSKLANMKIDLSLDIYPENQT